MTAPAWPELSAAEKAVYEWQMWTPGFGETGQRKLKGASVLVSRCGGLGGVVCYELAAAGVGRLVIAHAGAVKPSDLNRQLLMTDSSLGHARVDSAVRQLKALNPRLEIVAVAENVTAGNVEALVGQADLVVDAAPLFSERLLMNREAVRQRKPLVECAMYELSGTVFSVDPGRSACLRCVVPEPPEAWKRQFPVFGAVSGTAGCIGAMEAIKILAGLGEPLYGQMLQYDLRIPRFRLFRIERNPACPDCGREQPAPPRTDGTLPPEQGA